MQPTPKWDEPVTPPPCPQDAVEKSVGSVGATHRPSRRVPLTTAPSSCPTQPPITQPPVTPSTAAQEESVGSVGAAQEASVGLVGAVEERLGKPWDWQCPVCAHWNYGFRKKCHGRHGQCQLQRPQDDSRPHSMSQPHKRHRPLAADEAAQAGDWICQSCGNSNFNFRAICFMRRWGDWWCAACGNTNFAGRQHCNGLRGQCNAPKPKI